MRVIAPKRGHSALISLGVDTVVQQGYGATQAVTGADVAAHHRCTAAHHDDRQCVVVKACFQHSGEQPLGVETTLIADQVAHSLLQTARAARQHLLDLGVSQGQAGVLAYPLPHLVDTADHAEFKAVAGADDWPTVVNAHQVHRPPADVEQQQGGLVRQQVRLGHERRKALGEEKHILDCDAVRLAFIAEFGRLARIAQQVFSEGGFLPAVARQGQTRRNGDAALAGCAAGLQLLRDGRQRQQVVVVVGGLVPLDRLSPAAANKKTPAERKHVLAGVGFVGTTGGDTGGEGTVSSFDGVVAVVDAKNHGVSSLSVFLDKVESIYKAVFLSRVAG